MDIEKIINKIIDDIYNKYKDKVVSENYNPTRLIQDDYYKKLKPYFTEIRTLSAPELEKYIQYALQYTDKCKDKWVGREIWHGFIMVCEFIPQDK